MNNIYCYVLGSGIMNHPSLVYMGCFFTSAFFCSLLCQWAVAKESEKDGNNVWFAVAVIFFLLSIVSIFQGVYYLERHIVSCEEKNPAVIEKTEHENHEYPIYKNREIFHSPDRPCRILLRTKESREK